MPVFTISLLHFPLFFCYTTHMLKRFLLACLIQLLFFLSIWTWPHQSIFQQSFLGNSFFYWYGVLSLIVIIGLLLLLVKRNKFIIIGFCFLFFSWFLAWTSWRDSLPPKTYFPLDDAYSQYIIEKTPYDYGLCHKSKTGERLCSSIGSSVYPLDKYVDQDIVFTAQWRSDWGKPMCHTEPCPSDGRFSVIDILDIRLATPSSPPAL